MKCLRYNDKKWLRYNDKECSLANNEDGKLCILCNYDPPTEKPYPMCDPQPAQIDCRITECKYHDKEGTCTNVAPAVSLNPYGSFVCWSKKVIVGDKKSV